MNAYGPSFRYITPNHIVFEHETVHRFYQVNIDLNLDDNTDNDVRANIYGLTNGAEYPDIGSQIPAVYIQPNSMTLEVCTYLDGAERCTELDADAISANVWFNLKVEQFCWGLFPWPICWVSVLIDGESQFYWYNDSPQTFTDVSGVIGNTYGRDDIVAASGKYANFYLDQSEDGTGIDFVVTDEITDQAGAANSS